jgi:hypothetical protein
MEKAELTRFIPATVPRTAKNDNLKDPNDPRGNPDNVVGLGVIFKSSKSISRTGSRELSRA